MVLYPIKLGWFYNTKRKFEKSHCGFQKKKMIFWIQRYFYFRFVRQKKHDWLQCFKKSASFSFPLISIQTRNVSSRTNKLLWSQPLHSANTIRSNWQKCSFYTTMHHAAARRSCTPIHHDHCRKWRTLLHLNLPWNSLKKILRHTRCNWNFIVGNKK